MRPGRQALLSEALPRRRVVLPDSGRLEPATLFPNVPRAVWLEIGCGAGEHLAWQARHAPDVGLIGCEPYLPGLARLLGLCEDEALENVRLWPDDARLLLAALAPASIARAFILFPDPWPKLRHHKRRIVAPATLDRLADVMVDGAELRLATDDPDYLAAMLRAVRGHATFAWTASRAADWRQRSADWPETRYEAKARIAGRPPTFLRFVRRCREPEIGLNSRAVPL